MKRKICIILAVLMLIQIGSEGFPGKDTTAIPLVGEDVPYRAAIPFCAAGLGFAANIS